MHKITKEERQKVAHLFDGIEDSMVIAYLQGYMGDGGGCLPPADCRDDHQRGVQFLWWRCQISGSESAHCAGV